VIGREAAEYWIPRGAWHPAGRRPDRLAGYDGGVCICGLFRFARNDGCWLERIGCLKSEIAAAIPHILVCPAGAVPCSCCCCFACSLAWWRP